MNTLLELLEQDCTQSAAQLAAQAGMTEEEVKAEMARLEQDGTILGYQAIIDWDRVKRENVTALIEVKVVPQSIDGFDRIAAVSYTHLLDRQGRLRRGYCPLSPESDQSEGVPLRYRRIWRSARLL